MTRRSTRMIAAVAASASAVLAFSGCSVLGSSEPEVQPVAFDESTAATPGNAVLALGTPGNIVSDAGNALVSVLQITPGDPKIFDDWEDGEKFAGKTPYYLVVQTTTLTAPAGTRYPVFPVDQNGTPVEYVVNLLGSTELATGTADCPVNLPKAKDGDVTVLSCVIGLADAGEEVTGGMYTGEAYTDISGVGGLSSDPIYGSAPLSWSAAATAGPIVYDAEAIDMGQAAAATAPGTALGIGQPAWLPLDKTPETIVGTSVLKFVPGDESYFSRYSNASEFAGTTPTFVVVQFTYPDAATAEAGTFPALYPKLADGTDGQWMPGGGFDISGAPGLNQCPLVLPINDATSNTRIGCIVALGEGQAVTGMEYLGEAYGTYIANDALGYFSAPVTFHQ